MAESGITNPTNNNPSPAEPERTFTQAQVDAMIGERLSRERAKFADYDALKVKAGQWDAAQEAGKTELQKATEKAEALQAQLDQYQQQETLRGIRATVSKETGVPADLLTAETEDACRAQAQAIKAYKDARTYPQVKDGGEPTPPAPKKTTREQFAEHFNQFFND